jgi:DNA-binding response OmpR family regulator
VLTAESGREALRLAATHRGPIDLLISDVLQVLVDFIQKPFSPSALAAKVREMLDRQRSSRVEHT